MILGRTDSRGRLVVLLIVFVLFAGALIARLGWWQVARRDDLAASAHRQIYLRTEVPATRGAIYDRSGTVVLAATVTRDRLTINPKRLSTAQRDALVTLLTPALTLDETGVADLRAKLTGDRTYAVISGDLEPAKSAGILADADAASIPGLGVESSQSRVYPQSGGGPDTTLAAQLLGFVNRAGEGQYGVEQYYQDLLAGSPTVVESDRDANGQAVIETRHVVTPGLPGADVNLTIDSGLQLALEQELIQASVADRARSVSAVVIDPYTGAVLAEASYPSYDANTYSAMAATDPGRFVDPVVSEVYEPGSVFKLFTVIAGLESGTVTMTTPINDTGTMSLDGGKARISDADLKPMGIMKLEDGIAYSRNVVAARIALGLSPVLGAASQALHGVWTRFGFGQKTGIDVAGEVAGLVNDPAITPWRQIDLANGAFGQGIAVTPLQLASAYAAMVNGGTLIPPHVVGAIDGKPVAALAGAQVMDTNLTRPLTDLMHHVVSTVPFYRDRTLIPGFYVGGKTGTAQIWDSKGNRWLPNYFNFSFVGFVGRRDGRPDLVVAVKIAEARPTAHRTGVLTMPVMSFELFRRIATDALSIPGLLPELPPNPNPGPRPGN